MKVENLNFSYDSNKRTINDVSFELEENQILGILGHNGAGKSTLIKCITGILKPDSGKLEFGIDLVNNSRKYISYMPELNGIYERLSVYENIKFRAEIGGIRKDNIESDVDLVLEKIGLSDKKYSSIEKLSNGMKKRLSLGSAIISKPKILLLDEPTNGLDPESIDMIMNLILDLKKEGISIIINSHDLNFINSVCDKIIILQEGQLIYDGKLKGKNYEEIKEFYLTYTKKEVV